MNKRCDVDDYVDTGKYDDADDCDDDADDM